MQHKVPSQNFYLEIAYDGTDFHGWQIQEGRRVRTVQGALERAARQIFHRKIRMTAAGRTDTGVHARKQAISFAAAAAIPPDALRRAFNSILPLDVRVMRVQRVKQGFNARFNCGLRIYRYLILNTERPDVFLRNYSWFVPEKLDCSLMRKIAQAFIGQKDFSSFTNDRSEYCGSCRRTVKKITIRRRGKLIVIEIAADGFLRKMVRNIVSLLVEAGKNKRSVASIKSILKAKNRDLVGRPAPACGLSLWEVKYAKEYFRRA
jgi:tRNA pseudouridine38-40 synthase